MAASTNPAPIDPDDGIQLRAYLESLRGQMKSIRSMWDPMYAQLRYFFKPRDGRWDSSEINRGDRQDGAIINEHGTLCLRTLSAGMLTGMSSQTRDWFVFQPENPALSDNLEVKTFCETVAKRVRDTMGKSNFYQTLLEMYDAEGLFGTGAFLIEADAHTDIRCHPYPLGSYYLGVDDTLRVDLCIRELSMTARQLVEKFGRSNVSSAVLNIFDSSGGGNKETTFPVIHAIHKGSYYAPAKNSMAKWPWVSIWYEQGAYNDTTGVLRKSGFHECPLIAGRWRTVGENIYGESPCMDILGSVMSLQAWEERTAQAAERQSNPSMVASTKLDPRKLTTLPGEFSFVDGEDVSKVFKSAYDVPFRLDGNLKMIERIENRIAQGTYQSLFQMFTDTDRRQITAEEIRAKQAEKMQVLGPVVERNVDEVLTPAVMRILGILERIPGRLPPVPAVLKGQRLRITFASILAQAAQMVKLNNINQVMTFASQEAAINQGILDNFDTDKVARTYADYAAFPSDCIRPMDEVQQMRADKAKQAQQAQLAENANNLAQAAQTASQTPAGGGSLLQAVAPMLAGGGDQ